MVVFYVATFVAIYVIGLIHNQMQRYEFFLNFPIFSTVFNAVTSWRNSHYAIPNIAYNISLKGCDGGNDFDRSKIDK